MRGTVAKRIHAMQRSYAGLTWRKARRLWNKMMGKTDGQHPKLNEPRHRKPTCLGMRGPSLNRSPGHPITMPVSIVRSLSTLGNGFRRSGAFAKVSYRKQMSAWRRAVEEQKRHPGSKAAEAINKVIASVAAKMNKVRRFFQPAFRPQGRGA